MALKGIEEESDDSKDEDDDLAFIAKKIRKLLQYRKKDKNKAFKKSESFRKGRSEKPFIQYRECKGFGHMRIECPNYIMKEKTKKSKCKVLVSTLSDTESDLF